MAKRLDELELVSVKLALSIVHGVHAYAGRRRGGFARLQTALPSVIPGPAALEQVIVSRISSRQRATAMCPVYQRTFNTNPYALRHPMHVFVAKQRPAARFRLLPLSV